MNTSPSTPPRPPRDNGRRPRETTTTTGMSPQKSKQKNHHDNNNGVENITRGMEAVTSRSKATDTPMQVREKILQRTRKNKIEILLGNDASTTANQLAISFGRSGVDEYHVACLHYLSQMRGESMTLIYEEITKSQEYVTDNPRSINEIIEELAHEAFESSTDESLNKMAEGMIDDGSDNNIDFVDMDDGSDNNIDFVYLDYEHGLSEFMTPGTDPTVEKDDVVGEGGEEDDDDDDDDEDFPEEYLYKRIDPHRIPSMTPDDKPLPNDQNSTHLITEILFASSAITDLYNMFKDVEDICNTLLALAIEEAKYLDSLDLNTVKPEEIERAYDYYVCTFMELVGAIGNRGQDLSKKIMPWL